MTNQYLYLGRFLLWSMHY